MKSTSQPSEFSRLGQAEGRLLVDLAQETLAAHFDGRPPMGAGAGIIWELRMGAFVTIEEGGRLRGCIGRMESRDCLAHTVSQMALAAALEDPRFPPVDRQELPHLEIEVTVLGPLVQISGPNDFAIGEDGLLIAGKGRSGVLLPQVAVENGWDATAFLGQVCRKAGLDADAWRQPYARLYAFSGKVFSSKDPSS